MDAGRRRAHPDDEAEAQADRREVRDRDRGAVRGLSRTASNESVEVGQRAFDPFNAGGDAFLVLAHPDAVVVTDPSWPDGGEFRGIAQYRRFMSQFLEAFEGIKFKADSEPEAIGELGLFHGRWVGLGAASGAETTSMPFWVVVRARDGLLSEARFFFDEDKAREAASQT